MQDDVECPVCMNAVPQTSFQCGHRMCPRCAHTMLRHDSRCPICRSIITTCTPPLINCEGLKDCLCIELVRTIDDELFGITIGKNMTITHVNTKSIAYAAGVRDGYLLLEVNGIPCYDPRVVTRTIRQMGTFRVYLHTKPYLMTNAKMPTVRGSRSRRYFTFALRGNL
jgi:predicted metalloprotease with PDZ domain